MEVDGCVAGSGEEGIIVKSQRLGEVLVVEYGHLGVAIFPYHTPIHSLAIQRHRVYEDRL